MAEIAPCAASSAGCSTSNLYRPVSSSDSVELRSAASSSAVMSYSTIFRLVPVSSRRTSRSIDRHRASVVWKSGWCSTRRIVSEMAESTAAIRASWRGSLAGTTYGATSCLTS